MISLVTASEKERAQVKNSGTLPGPGVTGGNLCGACLENRARRCSVIKTLVALKPGRDAKSSGMEPGIEGETPVRILPESKGRQSVFWASHIA